jgi:hypothetical protein
MPPLEEGSIVTNYNLEGESLGFIEGTNSFSKLKVSIS